MSDLKIKFNSQDVQKMEKDVNKILGEKVKKNHFFVGIKEDKKYEKINVASVMYFHEVGTIKFPPRAWLTKSKLKTVEFLQNNDIVEDKLKEIMVSTIGSGDYFPLAQTTLNRRVLRGNSSSTPLADTGKALESIEVEKL